MKLLPKRRPKQAEMSVVDHLEELRYRLVIAVAAVGVGAIFGWFLFEPFLDLLRGPFCDAISELPEAARPPTGCDLVFNGPVEPFIIKLKVVVFLGLGIALPVVLFQLWRFITPGLTKKERRLGIPFVFASVLLFLLGGAFAYITLPQGLTFLLGFAGPGFVPLLTASRYIGFFILMTLAFGLSFEFPLVLIFLAAVHVITSEQLRRFRRYAILAIFIAAAIITPSQDPYTLLAMALPMVLFYEAAILITRLMKR